MQIDLNNILARVTKSTDEEAAWLHSFLSFEDHSSKFVRRRDGSVKVTKPKKISLLSLDGSFPAGLARNVKKAALAKSTIVNICDVRNRPCEPMTWEECLSGEKLWLHDFQKAAVEKAISRTRGILDIPTGGGKTEIAVGIAMRLGRTNTLFIAPEKDLMHNAARRWEKRTGVNAGRIGDGIMDPADGFTAATFQTLNSRFQDPKIRQYIQSVGCMIVDECHTLPSDTFYSVAQLIPAYWRIGMSGTPLARSDRRSLFSVAATGPVIFKMPTQELIDRGFISRPHIRMIPCEQSGEARSWQAAYTKFITASNKRNSLITYIAKGAPKPCLVFVREKRHGATLEKLLKSHGVRTEFIWGQKNTAQRDDAIRRLRYGELDVIVCSVVFQTGTDIPEIKSMVVAAGGKSEIATLQRIGRGMRVVRDANGVTVKDEFWVYDIMDTEPKSQAFTTGNKWNARHSRERFKSYTGVGHEVTIKEVV